MVGGYDYPPTVIIHAARRPKADAEAEPIRWTVEAADYETGKAEIEAEVGEDEVLLFVRPER
jgi:hypothetical protein